MQKLNFNIGKLIGFLLLIGACNTNPQTSDVVVDDTPAVIVHAPAFSADTAYHYIEKQLSFGPRAMNTKGHEACATFLINEVKKYADTVYVQRFDATGYDGKILKAQTLLLHLIRKPLRGSCFVRIGTVALGPTKILNGKMNQFWRPTMARVVWACC
jgi:hypothetical protein